MTIIYALLRSLFVTGRSGAARRSGAAHSSCERVSGRWAAGAEWRAGGRAGLMAPQRRVTHTSASLSSKGLKHGREGERGEGGRGREHRERNAHTSNLTLRELALPSSSS